MNRLTIIWVIVASLTACIPYKPIKLNMRYKKSPIPLMSSSCKEVFSIQDARKDKTSLGNYRGLPINTNESTEQWIKQAFDIHFKGKVQIKQEPDSPSKWRLRLKKNYVIMLANKLTANVAFSIENEEQNFIKVYRGTSVSTNWGGGNSEILSALNSALFDGLKKMSADIKDICKTDITT